jgi:putative Mn2+ efflux pump MntP
MHNRFKAILIILGIALGLYHLWAAIKAMYVFRNDEPVSLFVFTFTGPLSTLPASITAAFNRKVGSAWLIGGAVIAFIAAMIAGGEKWSFEAAIWFLSRYSGPMLILGLAFLVSDLKGDKQERDEEKKPG